MLGFLGRVWVEGEKATLCVGGIRAFAAIGLRLPGMVSGGELFYC